MKKTEKYKLNLIETDDTFGPEALNENARKLETELDRVEEQFRGQLETELARVEGLFGGRLAYNIREYTGNGQHGKDHPNRLEFDIKPLIVWVGQVSSAIYGHYSWVRGTERGATYSYDAGPYSVYLTWEDRALEWYHSASTVADRLQLNEEGTKYICFAIGVQE